MLIPKPIEEMLRRYGLQGNTQEWECSVRPLSEDSIVLEFKNYIVLHVVDSTWTRKTLAELEAENITVGKHTIKIPCALSSFNIDISLYADGSILWIQDGKINTTDWTVGSSQQQLAVWKKELIKKSRSLWNICVMKNKSYEKLMALLNIWETQQREKHDHYCWTIQHSIDAESAEKNQ